jgi:hypothetical protein
VIIHAAMAAPATASSSATMTIINTVVETPRARLLVRSLSATHQARTPPQDHVLSRHGMRYESRC